ncbi:MAG: hypothetical protein KGR26_03150 [Cyanobacteria bacterium REEB65]|nr:hypothetical protein [Cyanobacteria bacterium REEB65]
MADFVIPVDSSSTNYTVDVSLSGGVYRFGLFWNTRGQFWSLDIFDQTDKALATGLKLVADWELISGLGNSALPPGFLYCVDTSGRGLDPTESDLGTRVILLYDDGLPA